MNGQIKRADDGMYRLVGKLDFNTVPELWQSSDVMFARQSKQVVVDLLEVSRADSAGLALLVGWVRRARALGIEAEFRNVPDQLLAIARVSGVEEMLPISSAGG